MVAIAACASIATLIGFLFTTLWNDLGINSNVNKLIILVMLILICVIYACTMTARKTKIWFRFNQQFRLTIEQGDLFEKKGVVVIPVNEYFDTNVNERIISSETIHGKFIQKYFKDNVEALDEAIDSQLSSIAPVEDNIRHDAKSKKYELGTCVDVHLNGNTYVLVAFTHFDKDEHAYLPKNEFPIVLDKLIMHLNGLCVDTPCYMPLMGTGLSRMKRASQRVLNFIVDAIDFKYSDMSFPKGMFIEIYKMADINLNQLESHFENDLSI